MVLYKIYKYVYVQCLMEHITYTNMKIYTQNVIPTHSNVMWIFKRKPEKYIQQFSQYKYISIHIYYINKPNGKLLTDRQTTENTKYYIPRIPFTLFKIQCITL